MINDEKAAEMKFDELIELLPVVVTSFATCEATGKVPLIVDSEHIYALCLTHIKQKSFCNEKKFLIKFRKQISCSVDLIELKTHQLTLFLRLQVPEISVENYQSYSVSSVPLIIDKKILVLEPFYETKYFETTHGNYLVRESDGRYSLQNRSFREEACLTTLVDQPKNTTLIRQNCLQSFLVLKAHCHCQFLKDSLYCVSIESVRVEKTQIESGAVSSSYQILSGYFFHANNLITTIYCKDRTYSTHQVFTDESVSYQGYTSYIQNSFFDDIKSLDELVLETKKTENETDLIITEVDKDLHSFLVANSHWFSISACVVFLLLSISFLLYKCTKKRHVSVTNYIPATNVCAESV